MLKKHLYINSRFELYRVELSKIVYFEADGNCTNFILVNRQKGVLCMNLSKTQSLLTQNLKEQAQIFARIGKRFIINLTFVYHIDILKQRLTLSDGVLFTFLLPVSKEALKKLKDLYVASGTSAGRKDESN